MKIPFFSLDQQHQTIWAELDKAIARVLKKSQFVLGEEVLSFEKEFAFFQNTKHCVSVANGLDALFISLKALGIDKGDEVIVPSHTFVATWLAVSRAGATPVPVEVDPACFTINTLLIEQAITNRTKAIIPVNLYGHPCRLDEILKLAIKYQLFVVEDNAQAHGALYDGKMTGSWGHINATSFYPTKNLGALGDGGAITTDNSMFGQFAGSFRNYGSLEKDSHELLGINSRLDEMQAAILRIKLQHLEERNNQRRKNASLYFEQLKNVGDIILPPNLDEKCLPVYHLFVIQANHRDRLKNYLGERGVGTAIHYPTPIHLQEAYKNLGYMKGSLPVAERLSETVLSLPIWPGLGKEQIEFICNCVKDFFKS